MANICDTQYKVTGSRKAVADLWNTLQELEVNSNNVYLYLLAEHYGGKSSVRCPLKPSDSIPLCPNNPAH